MPFFPSAPASQTTAYSYKCVDRSWLSAWIARRLAPPLEALLPPAWSANVITGVGAGLMWVLLALALGAPPAGCGPRALLGVLLLWSYCVLDHVDGCRARRRGTSSAWGEFLDHGLDAWHGSMMVAVAALCSGAAVRPAVAAATMAATGLATVATWIEQRWRGEFYLGRVGPVEAVLVAGLYLATWGVPGADVWWSGVVLKGGGVTRAEAVLVVGGGGALVAAATAVVRAPGCFGMLMVFAVSTLAILAAGFGGAPWPLVGAALTLATAGTSAEVLVSHLARRPCPWPDVAGAGLLLLGAFGPGGRAVCFTLGLAWLAARTIRAWRQALALRPALIRKSHAESK